MKRNPPRILGLAVTLALSPSLYAADILINVSQSQILNALGIPEDQVVSFSTNGTDARAIGIADTSALGIIEDPKSGNNLDLLLSNGYPTEGREFLIISSGDATAAAEDNDADNTSTTLDGLKAEGPQGTSSTDLAQINMVLRAPETARCASFDFSFFSEEYNEFIGSNFNDTFLIEKGDSDFVVTRDDDDNYAVTAPKNFAFDTGGNVISVNAAFDTVCNPASATPEECSTGTTYDNATIKLRASTPVTGGEDVRFVISIMDLGDSIYDSAAFIDKFLWSTEDCASGAQEIQDADGDGLLDDWETSGVTVDLPNGGTAFIDLPAMGADPNRKDLFIEVDWMAQTGLIDYRPLPEMLQKVIDAYAAVGVTAHIDAGPNSLMNPETSETWDSMSAANAIDLVDTLGTASGANYDWTAFDALKETHFNAARRTIFHYVIIGHRSPFAGVPYISRSLNASDLFLPWADLLGTLNEQAGSFLKGTGLNLALREGGSDNSRNKPQYLSVMNPLYTFDGVILDGIDGHLRFSDGSLAPLDEAALDEAAVLPTVDGQQPGVKHQCNGGLVAVADTSAGIDWNCNGAFTAGVVADINGSGAANETLRSVIDLNRMRFAGGLIGEPSALIQLPTLTEVAEYAQSMPTARDIPSLYEVSVLMPSTASASGTVTQRAVIRNRGTLEDTYTVSGVSSLGGADFSGLLPSYTIAPGERVTIEFPVTLPGSGTDTVTLTVTSATSSTIEDIAVAYATPTAITAGPGALHTTVLYEDGNPFESTGGGSLHPLMLLIMTLTGGWLVRRRSVKA